MKWRELREWIILNPLGIPDDMDVEMSIDCETQTKDLMNVGPSHENEKGELVEYAIIWDNR